MPILVELFDDLDAVARDAGDALGREARRSIFERIDWFRLTERHCPLAGQPLILRAKRGEDRAWLFLTVEGRKAQAFATWYSFGYSAVIHCPSNNSSCLDLVSAMARALKGRSIHSVELYPLESGDLLPVAFRNAGWLTIKEEANASWRIDTAGMTFADYLATLPSHLRNTATRKAKKTGITSQIYDRFDAVAWHEYEEVYRKSWKPPEGSPSFLRALAEQEGKAGTLRLGIARYEGRPVAAQFWLVENGAATIHKLAYDEAAKSLSPGTMLSLDMSRHVLEKDKAHLIDFGLGDDPFKAGWMEKKYPILKLHAFDSMSLGGIGGFTRKLLSSLVRGLRTG